MRGVLNLKNWIGTAVMAIGTTASALLGGWDAALETLVALMIVDYFTGLLSAIREKRVNSDVMFWGGIRKVSILVIVAICYRLDGMMGNGAPIFRTLAVWFYAGREGLSVVENLGIIGVPLPSWLKGILEQIEKKGDTKDGDK